MKQPAEQSNLAKSAVEREVKLTVDADFRLPLLPGAALPEQVLTSVYYDTPDFRLARGRMTLRHRTVGNRRAWQLKLPLDGGRREIEMPGKGSTLPSPMRDLLFIHLQGRAVAPITTLRTRRTGIRVGGSKGVDVVLDEVAVLNPSSEVLVFREVEIERLDGDAALLTRVEKRLRNAGSTDHDGRPKMFRALDLPAPARPKPPHGTAPAREHLRYILRRQLDTILSRDPGVRLGGDSEDVHQLRVATRRMRSVLRVAGPLLKPEWVKPLRQKLRWLGRRLGKVRDLDVQIAYFKTHGNGLNPNERAALQRLIRDLQLKRHKAQGRLLSDLRRPRYVGLINRLVSGVPDLPVVSNDADLPDLARRAFTKLRKTVKKLDESATDAQWHRVRIMAKRARYAAELSEQCSGRAATRFINKIKVTQDQLGEIQDAVIAEAHLRRFARKDGDRTGALVSHMIERQRQRRRELKQAFFSSWKYVKKSGKEAWA